MPDSTRATRIAINCYVSMVRSEGVVVRTEAPRGEHLQLTDPGTGEVTGYIGGEVRYDPDKVALALLFISAGIEKHPDRLDMHLGKVHLLGEVGDFARQQAELKEILDRSAKNDPVAAAGVESPPTVFDEPHRQTP